MSIILDLPINFVTIDPVGDCDGIVDPGDDFKILQERVLMNRNATDDEKNLLLNYIMAIYAGPMSHGLYLNKPMWWNYLIGGGDDLQAKQIMRAIYFEESDEMCFDLKNLTKKEMEKEETREMIRKIAEALLSGRRRLTLQECKGLL